MKQSDFNIKGNNCYEIQREASDGLVLIGDFHCLFLLTHLFVFWGNGGKYFH